ncbi:MAG: TetR family transcriptional regulator [Rhodospirillales bacterium]|nr:TetR family transcriptional regulator [Rhodospirillales bacterium]
MAKTAHPSKRAANRGKTRRRTAAPETDPAQRLIAAALALAETKGWAATSLADIAAKADVAIGTAEALFPSKAALLIGFMRDIDDTVVAAGPAVGGSARDRLFEVMMRRYDALSRHKAGIKAIARDLGQDRMAGLCVLAAVPKAMTAMLTVAGVPAEGMAGMLRAAGLGIVNAVALRAWLDDDTPDMTKTMAALDNALLQAQKLSQFIDLNR